MLRSNRLLGALYVLCKEDIAMRTRLYYLDNLRVALTVLIIAHHVAQAYGPTGGDWPIQEVARSPLLGPFFTVNRSFFMSLFFMIAGYFAAPSCDAKGPRAFMRGRALRLGLPVVAWIVIVATPFQILGGRSPWPLDAGHLWFLEHLLILSGVYALWRAFRPKPAAPAPEGTPPPRTWAILLFALGIAVASGLIRIWRPIDRWDYLLGFVRVAFADVPRDVAFFFVGILAFRHGWLSRFSTKAGYAWLAVGLFCTALMYVYDLWLYRLVPLEGTTYDVLRLLWEGLFVCGMCIGLTVLFREKLNGQTRLSGALARGQYAAYIFHVLIVLAFQAAVLSLPIAPLAKFALVTVVATAVTFLFSIWVSKPLHL
jgi:glucans biosynthesis protein C